MVSSIWEHSNRIPDVVKSQNEVVKLDFHEDFGVFGEICDREKS